MLQWTIVISPLNAVSFADFWLADQFISLTPAFLDIEYFICFYSTEVPWVTGGSTGENESLLLSLRFLKVFVGSGSTCTSNSNAIRPILSSLPAWFRFAQCIRRYRDSRLAFPHLLNASRYAVSFFVVLFSSLSSLHAGEQQT